MFKVGSRVKVFVTFLETPGSNLFVWAQTDFEAWDELESQLRDAAEQFGNGKSLSDIEQVNTGDIYVAKYEDDVWYRCQVVSTDRSNATVTVNFIDFGNTEVLGIKDIVSASPQFFKSPPLAQRFQIGDILPKNNGKWSNEEVAYLKENITNAEFLAKITDEGSGGLPSTMQLLDTKHETPLIQKFIGDGIGTKVEAHVFPTKVPSLKLTVGKTYPVYVTFVNSTVSFIVQLSTSGQQIEDLALQISTTIEPESKIYPGQMCVSQDSNEDMYYRAVITNVTQEGCSLTFIDYGNSEKVPQSNIKVLHAQHTELPAQAIPCCLIGKDALRPNFDTFVEREDLQIKVLKVLGSGINVVEFVEAQENSSLQETSNFVSHSACSDSDRTVNVSASENNNNTSSHRDFKALEVDLSAMHDVCISHVEKSGTFYCQLLANAPKLDAMMCDLQNQERFLIQEMPVIDMPCAIQSSKDNLFYRARVLKENIGQNLVLTVLVDFGDEEVVSKNQVYHLAGSFCKLPEQCFKCQLVNGFGSKSVAILSKYKGSKALLAKVVGNTVDCYELDLLDTSSSRDINICDLITRETTDNGNHGNQKPPAVTPKASVPVTNIPEGKEVGLYVTAVLSDDIFFGQLSSFNADDLDSFQKSLNDYYVSHSVSNLDNPEIGDICCTLFSEDGLHYRSRIQKIRGEQVGVIFLDYGNTEIKALGDVKELSSQFCQLPQQGILCSLAGMYTGQKKADLVMALLDQEILVVIQKKMAAGHQVTLPGNEHIQRFRKQDKPVGVATVTTSMRDSMDVEYQKKTLVVGKKDEVLVSHIDDPEHFFCQQYSSQADLNALSEEIEVYAAGCTDTVQAKGLGVPVIAKDSNDGWFRASISGVRTNGKVELNFVDYGNYEEVEASSLRPMKAAFMKLPVQAIHCQLDGVDCSADGIWSPDDTNKLWDLVNVPKLGIHVSSYDALEDHYTVEIFDGKKSINEEFGKMTNKLRTGFVSSAAEQIEQVGTSATGGSQSSGNNWAKGFEESSKKSQAQSGGWDEQDKTTPVTASSGFSGASPGNGFGSKGEFNKAGGSSDRAFGNRDREDKGGFGNRNREESGGFRNREESRGFGNRNREESGGFNSRNSEGFGNRNREESGGFNNRNREESAGFGNRNREGGGFGNHGRESNGGFGNRDKGFGTRDSRSGSEDKEDRGFGGKPRDSGFGGRNSREGGFGGERRNFDQSTSRGSGFGERSEYSNRDGRGFGGSGDNRFSRDQPSRSGFGGGRASDSRSGFGRSSSSGVDCNLDGGNVPLEIPVAISSTPKLKLTENEYVDVFVTFAVDPSHFWCQLKKNSTDLDTLMEELGTEYTALGPDDLVCGHLSKSQLCCAKYSVDEGWYRAKVTDISDNAVDVLFVDYGNTENVNKTNVKLLKERYLKLPFQAFLCTLNGVEPSGSKWSEESIDKFQDITIDKQLVACIVQRKGDSYVVELIDHSTQVHEELVKAGLAKNIELLDASSKRPQRRLSSASSSSRTSNSSRSSYAEKTDKEIKHIQLNKHKHVDVNISFVNTPQDFWCQLTENTDMLQQVMDGIKTKYESINDKELLIANPCLGQICCGQFTEDDAWYRANIQEMKEGKVKVKFLDYGNEEWLALDRVRELDGSFYDCQAQALNCSMYGIKPTSDKWTDEASEAFEELTVEKNLVAKVVSKQGQKYFIRLYDIRDKKEVSIGDEFVDLGQAIRDPETDMSFAQPKVDMGSTHNALPSWINSSQSFFCQLERSQSEMEHLAESLFEFYQKLKLNDMSLPDPYIGQPCVSYYAPDGNWYRSVVHKLRANEAMVIYVDYGNKAKVPLSKVKEITSAFLKPPLQVIHCKLSGLKFSDDKWSREAISVFQKSMSSVLSCKFISMEKDLYSVELTDSDGISIADNVNSICRGDGPLRKDVAPSRPIRSTNGSSSSTWKTNEKTDDTWGTDDVPAPETTQAAPEPVKQTSGTSPAKDQKFTTRTLPSGPVTVFVTDVTSPAKFFVQVADEAEGLEQFAEVVHSELEAATATLSSADIGTICGSKFADDNCWYRARVTDVQGTEASLVFVDYGNKDKMKISDLKHLQSSLVEKVPFAIECSLTGVKCPTAGWSDDQIQRFETTAGIGEKEFSAIFAEKGAMVEVKLLDGELDVSKEFIDEATVPTPALKYSAIEIPRTSSQVYISHVVSPAEFHIHLVDKTDELDQLMVQMGEFQPKEQLESASSGEPCSAVFHEDGSWYRATVVEPNNDKFNVFYVDYGNTGTVGPAELAPLPEGLLGIPPFAIKCCLDGVTEPSSGWKDDDVNKLHDLAEKELTARFVTTDQPCIVTLFDGEVDVGRIIQDSSLPEEESLGQTSDDAKTETVCSAKPVASTVEVIEENFPVELLSPGRTQVYVSHVETPSELYVQLSKRSVELEQLVDRVDAKYGCMSDSENLVESISAGQICCAKMSSNEVWYRAKVLSSGPEGYTVRYVDYGNTEVIPLSNIKELTKDLKKIAGQSFQCSLVGASQQHEWSDETIDKLFNLTTDKILSADVKSDSVPYKVVIYDKEDCINQAVLADLYVKELENAAKGDATDAETVADSAAPVDEDITEAAVAEVKTEATVAEDDTETAVADDTETAVAEDETEAPVDVNQDTAENKSDVIIEVSIPPFEVDGDQLQVFVSAVESPVEFYVQGTDSEDGIQDLSSKMTAYYEAHSEGLKLKSPSNGQICCTRYYVDDSWCRTRVKDVREEGVSVFFIDYGNTDIAAPHDLYTLVPEFTSQPMFAGKCALSGIPSSETWSDEQTDGFLNRVQGIEITATVLDQKELLTVELFDGESNITAELFPDLTKNETESTVQEMGNAEAGEQEEKSVENTDPESETTEAQPTDVRDESTSEIPETKDQELSEPLASETVTVHDQLAEEASCDADDGLEMGTKLEVYVTEVVSPSKFWCHKVSVKRNLDQLLEEMAAFYEAADADSMPDGTLQAGTMCAAHTSDSLWYRAQVLSDHEDSAQVSLVDYGQVCYITHDNLRQLHERFLALQIQSMECILSEIQAKDGKWSGATIQRFKDLVMEKKLLMEVVMKPDFGPEDTSPILVVSLLDMGIGISQILLQEELCIDSTDAKYPIRSSPSPSAKQLLLSPQPHESAVAHDNLTAASRQLDFSFAETPKKAQQAVAPECLTLPISSKFEVFVSHIESLDEFYIQLKSSEGKLESLLTDLQDYYENNEDTLDTVKEGEVVMAKSQDGYWYRSRVTSVEDDQVTVQFLDYGNTETVDQEHVQSVMSTFRKLPFQALMCKLDEVKPAGDHWDDNIIDAFSSLAIEKCLLAEVRQDLGDSLHLVQLLDMGVSLSQTLLEQYPTGVLTLSTAKTTIETGTDDCDLSAVEDVCLKEQQPTEQVEETSEEPKPEDDVEEPSKEPHQEIADDEAPSGVIPESYKNPELVECGELEVFVSYADTPEAFWCQLAVTSNEELPLLQDRIQDYCSHLGPEEQILTEPAVGAQCLAVYSDVWYRAQVTKVCEGAKVEVSFIDYGNLEEVSCSSLKAVPSELMMLPKQAFQCKLSEIRPLTEGLWDEASCTRFHELVMYEEAKGFKLTVQEVKKEDSSLVLVIGQLTDDDLNIADQLVQGGYALKLEDKVPEVSQAPTLPASEGSTSSSRSDDPEVQQEIHNMVEKIIKDARAEVEAGLVSFNKPESDGGLPEVETPLVEQDQTEPEDVEVNCDDPTPGDTSETTVPTVIVDTGTEEACADLDDQTLGDLDGDYATDEEHLGTSDAQAFARVRLTLDSVVDMFVVLAKDPDNIVLQPVEMADQLHELMDKLHELYSENEAPNLETLQEGQPCCAKFTEDDAWYRAHILNVARDQQVEVYYVDYGNTETVSKDHLRLLDQDVLSLPAQAIKCTLAHITPVSEMWSKEAGDLVESLCGYHNDEPTSMKVKVTEVDEDNRLTATLTTRDGQDVSAELVSQGLAKTLGADGSKETVKLTNGVDEADVDESQDEEDSDLDLEIADSIPQRRLVDGEQYDVFLTHCVSPSQLWCQVDAAEVDHVMDMLEEYYCGHDLSQGHEWVEGNICCAKSVLEDRWHRAQIQSCYGNLATVRFMDYGSEETVELSNICPLLSRFSKQPQFAVECQLYGLKTVTGEWDDKAAEVLQDLADTGLRMVVKEIPADGAVKVTLTPRNGSSLAEALVSQRLARRESLSES